MDKKVSIITPCFNGAEFVGRFLNSILDQTYKNIELIFVNDGSNDNTEEVVNSYVAKFNEVGMKLIYIYQENSGQAAALDRGLKLFSGDYLTWPDSDDILAADSIEKKVKFLEENTEYGLVRTDAKLVDEDNLEKVIGNFAKNNPNKYKENLFLDFIIENRVWFAPGCYMIRSSDFLNVNPERTIYKGKGGQNWQMFLPMMYYYKCGYIDEALYTYVVRKNSHSHSTISLESQINRCDEHEMILYNTLKNININSEELKGYYNIIKEKYIRKRFRLSCIFNDRILSEKYYEILKKEYSCGNKEKALYLSTRNIIFNIGYRVIRKLKRNFIK